MNMAATNYHMYYVKKKKKGGQCVKCEEHTPQFNRGMNEEERQQDRLVVFGISLRFLGQMAGKFNSRRLAEKLDHIST